MSLRATCWAFGLRDVAPKHKLALIILSDSCGCGEQPDEVEVSPDRVEYWARVYGCTASEFQALIDALAAEDLLSVGTVEGRDGGLVDGLILNMGAR